MWMSCWRSVRLSEVLDRLRFYLAVLTGWYFMASPVPAAGQEKVADLYPMVEIAFSLAEKASEPFAKELWGWIETDGGRGVWVPAFYDGEGIWKLRYSPRGAGHRRVSIYSTEAGIRRLLDVANLAPNEFDVNGEPLRSGFVRVNPEDSRRFLRMPGGPYYPLGINVGWETSPEENVEAILTQLAAAGGNWARIWMCHWDGKNLDWVPDQKNPIGEINLEAARRWDRIVALAGRLDIPFQMVLQHHGQFSTTVNPNWKENPWNEANGGFLKSPEAFFTDPRALELTRRKLRYIVARYGYSPAIMAWELFNEVEFTDAAKSAEGGKSIFEWHEKMAAYLREIDPNGHLITTSAAPLSHPVWLVADYIQQHAYPPDPLSGSGGFEVNPMALSRPIFYGEIGTTHPSGASFGDGGRSLRDVLWGSLFSGAGGAAQYWAWDQVAREKLFSIIQSAAAFAKRADLASGQWWRLPVKVTTEGQVDLVFGPGQRWNSMVDPEFSLLPDGGSRPEGVGWSATLRPRRGSGERVGTDRVTFNVEAEHPTRWDVDVSEVSDDGATIELLVDGSVKQTRKWEPASPGDGRALPETIGVDVPAGTKTLLIKSSGRDFFRLSGMRLKNYAPELGAKAMATDDRAILWIYRLEGLAESRLAGGSAASRGKIQLVGLRDGIYRLVWWDTLQAKEFGESEIAVNGGKVEIMTPEIRTDAAALITRKGGGR